MRERSATRNFAENLDADADDDDGTKDGQRDRQDCRNSAKRITGNRAKGSAESSHNRISSSLKNYPLPLKILVAMATAARIP